MTGGGRRAKFFFSGDNVVTAVFFFETQDPNAPKFVEALAKKE
jgi:hypothetical protein